MTLFISLLGTLLGFGSSVVPALLTALRDRADRQHELAVLRLQIEAQQALGQQRLEEIRVEADSRENEALYRSLAPSGIKWADAYVQTVRPTVTYLLFLLYLGVKAAQCHLFLAGGTWLGGALPGGSSSALALGSLWSDAEMGMLSYILSFWFGHRAFQRARGVA
ncbi:MAG TPA: hypothetical protein VL359_19250 [bacterium]|nr:hypothetical protein [bacterium]